MPLLTDTEYEDE
ncbi:uncharacterized protein DNG_07815 [Cephalotrichum gorgonifer]|uniref:Uncharacterized protein n=1 Tax=Cephalotrichum gorgonifer TaxID=2041049 RepID=A0AAE8SXU3_9PEZI|nr:uncharacterized protein DNG_07815 [Cephalotrichum gorgonifer]